MAVGSFLFLQEQIKDNIINYLELGSVRFTIAWTSGRP